MCFSDLRNFFECLPNVMNGPDSRFSFCTCAQINRLYNTVHGLAATNLFFYSVYTRVAELDLHEIGLTTEWQTLRMQVEENTWKGVKRKYWTLDDYYLPVSRMQLVD